MYIACGMYKEIVKMYGDANNWNKAQQIASQYLDPQEVSEMFLKQAENLESNGKYRDAEKLYISIDAADSAIAMYKKVEQYENMVFILYKYSFD